MDVSPERLVEQANERFQLQDYYGAIHLLEEVIATGRAFADAHHLLGLSYSLAGQPDKALEQLDRALALNPNYIEALIHRALVLNELGREEEANAVLRRARQVTSERRGGFHGHVAAKLANLHAALGQAYIEAGGLNEAIAQYEAALALGPAFHDLRYKLGRLLLEAGRALDAHEHFQIIVRERPSFLDAAAMLGLANYLAGDGLAARAVWEELRARRPEDPRVEAYLALLSRADEAADGLDRVARAALAANDRTALASALTGLREVAPRRPLGRYVVLAALDAVDRGDTAEAKALLPVAAASAVDASRADSLLFVYGMMLVRVRDCSTAVRVFEGVVRRDRAPAVSESAREGLGLCALVAGQMALESGRPGDAEDWFRRATAPGASPDVVRAAFLGLGDVRLAQGDIAGAMDSYQQALAGGTPGDTISQRAQEKLNKLGKAEPE